VVLGVVDRVDTDGVDSKILEVGNVALQAVNVEERVLSISRTTCRVLTNAVPSLLCYVQRTWLVGNTANVETLIASEESIALDSDWGQLSLALASDNAGEYWADNRAERGKENELHSVDRR
jgi:hypothetical protein